MPKKTKKEKLLARQHRSHSPSVAMSKEPLSGDSSSPVSQQFTLSLPQQSARSNSIKSDLPNEYATIKKDIVKTVFVTSIILISEFLLTKWLPR